MRRWRRPPRVRLVMALIVVSVHSEMRTAGGPGDFILGVQSTPTAGPLTVNVRSLTLGPILGAYFGTIGQQRRCGDASVAECVVDELGDDALGELFGEVIADHETWGFGRRDGVILGDHPTRCGDGGLD